MSTPSFESLLYGMPALESGKLFDKTPLTADEVRALKDAYRGADNLHLSAQSGVSIIGHLVAQLGMADVTLDCNKTSDVGWLLELLAELIGCTDHVRANLEHLLREKGHSTEYISKVSAAGKPCTCTPTTTIEQARELINQAIECDEIKLAGNHPHIDDAIELLGTLDDSNATCARTLLHSAQTISTDKPAARKLVSQAAEMLMEVSD